MHGYRFCCRFASIGFSIALLSSSCANESEQFDAATSANPMTKRNPNIVTIMVDDLDELTLVTAIDLGLMSNLNQYLIQSGQHMVDSFVSNSVCCPSRATMLTGQFSHNNGVLHNVDTDSGDAASDFPDTPSWQLGYVTGSSQGGVTALNDESTLATWFSSLGYRTGYIGKYLNGYGWDGTDGPTPDPYSEPPRNSHHVPDGWDEWHGLVDPSTYCVYDYTINHTYKDYFQPGEHLHWLQRYGNSEEDYQTRKLADLAASFVTYAENIDSQPFFLVVMPMAPHLEVDVQGSCDGAEIAPICLSPLYPADYRKKFCHSIRPDPQDLDSICSRGDLPLRYMDFAAFNEPDVQDKPAWIQEKPRLGPLAQSALRRQWCRRIESLIAIDRLIGDIVAILEQNGELDNTIIVFTADNGWHYGEHRLSSKATAYEESIRVPLFVRLADRQSASGKTREGLVVNTDLAPTLLDLAGVDLDEIRDPATGEPWPFDGQSFVPLLAGSEWPRKRILIEHWDIPGLPGNLNHIPDYFAIRTASTAGLPDRLYVEYETEREYYLVQNDRAQEENVFGGHPVEEAILSRILAQMKTCVGLECQQLENAER